MFFFVPAPNKVLTVAHKVGSGVVN